LLGRQKSSERQRQQSGLCRFLQVVEVDYGKKADKFSYEGRYAALLLVQELPSLSHRIDCLFLKTLQSQEEGRGEVFERLGVLKLSFYNTSETCSSMLRALKRTERSLEHRLNLEAGPRRSSVFSAKNSSKNTSEAHGTLKL
jgi:hypothetical protein